MPEDQDKEQSSNEELLKECREDFRYHKAYWKDNYDESAKDMDCAALIPPKEFTDDRKDKPCIWPDEISQYIKQANNNQRQNKRSIKISPRSEDATDEDAEHRQAYIRGIEYASKAQSIYTTAFESAALCGFGYWRLTTQITGPNGEQEPRLKRIPNWATVFPDPDAREADLSDQDTCFVVDSMRESKFKTRYPKAKKQSFSPDDRVDASEWFFGENIVVGEWWKRKHIESDTSEKTYKVTQRITNGVEFLETNEWIGSWIPIIGVYGEELYIKEGSQSKRVFMSLIRRARAPQQMLAYVASKEAEEFGMATAAPYLVFKGSVDGDIWKLAHKTPMAFLEYSAPLDWNMANGAPPAPQRVPFSPNVQAYQAARESWRRAIQAAMGINPLPTSAQRQNEKSGIALEKIQNAEAVGAFHITDNYVRALGNTGRQANELITKLAELDSLPKQVLGKDQKDEDKILKITRSTKAEDANSEHLDEADQFFAHRGQFEVAVSDGANYLSQREEQAAFADTLLQSLPAMGLPPALTQQILAIAVKLKNLGSYGDEIHDILAPQDQQNIPPQARAAIAHAQGQVQLLTQELQKLQLEKLGKVTEIQGKKELALMDHVSTMAEADKDRETKLAVAEVMTKAQSISERLDMVHDLIKQFHDQAHDLASQSLQQKHEKDIADQQAANASMQSAQDASQNQAAAEAAPAQ